MGWYEERSDRQIPAPDQPRPTPGKKNTRRWCKGKVGREHEPVIRPTTNGWRHKCHARPAWAWSGHWWFYGNADWWCSCQRVCTTCGKVLEWRIDPDLCPERSKSVVKEKEES